MSVCGVLVATVLATATPAGAQPGPDEAAPPAPPGTETPPAAGRRPQAAMSAPLRAARRAAGGSLERVGAALLGARPDLAALAGRPIRAISVETSGQLWKTQGEKAPAIRSVPVGTPLSEAVARRAVRELLQSGAYAEAQVDVRPYEDGVILRLVALPRRVVAGFRISGDELDAEDLLEAAQLKEDSELTEPMFPRIVRRLQALHKRRGYDSSHIDITTSDTDDPLRVVLHLDITAGPRRTVRQRIFVVEPWLDPVIGDLKQEYEVEAGDPVDEDALDLADGEMEELLQGELFLGAQVQHRMVRRGPHAFLYVYLDTGPKYRFEFDGNLSFDDADLLESLDLEDHPDENPSQLAERVRAYHEVRGLLDATVDVSEGGGPGMPFRILRFRIREGRPVQVTRRVFPCLDATATQHGLSVDQLQEEIDGTLAKALPSPPLITPVDPESIDGSFGPGAAGTRARPIRLRPAMTYSPEAYEQVTEHLRDLLNSKGFMNAVVGPVSPIRARCDPKSRAGACRPLPQPEQPAAQCSRDALGLPQKEPPLAEPFHCQPDRHRGIHCAQTMTVRIPIQLGPRTTLYDVVFEGNAEWSATELLVTADYPMGAPLSNLELDAARQRLIDRYRDAGYAYASVRTQVELSPDRTRARARFIVNEHEPVTISGYLVIGAKRTDRDLIIGRLALCSELTECEGEELYYKRDLVRKSEEQIATLGTFTSVTIGLEDPEVPQKRKRVVITVVEQPSQYLEPRIGFSTGEGFRGAFEYGHRNIGGQAIGLTVRLELSILPELLILEEDVRKNYEDFTVSKRLERRNRVSVRFPEIGLGPLVSLTVDGIDIRDNQRDFGLTKDAVIPTVTYSPWRTLHLQLAASTEVNDVEVFGAENIEQAIRLNPSLSRALRVPDGRTIALAQRVGAAWDRRDNAFAATEGTLMALDVEHVHAFPLDDTATIESEFLRFSGRTAGYLKLTDSGLVLAISLGGGYNLQLTDSSQTYPDRLFYLGGVDTIRGFPLDSVVPEDVAQKILDGTLAVESVSVRGGDFYLNPRAELRIPLSDLFSLGAFFDTGNVWTVEGVSDFDSPLDLLQLRYALGSGLRIATPIGPIAVDLGFNLLRREWEDLAAIHFAIGLF